MNNSVQPGAGFFPSIIGTALIILSTINLIKDFKESDEQETDKQSSPVYIKDTIWIIVFILLFISLLKPLGALVTMVIFTFITLVYLNRGKIMQNTVISIVFPVGLYLLFEVWLKAGVPEGILG